MDTVRGVKLRIVADAGTAKETLDEIAAKTDQLDGKKSSIRVGINSGTTKADLDEITAKADELGIKNVTFTVKADTKPARAELDALKIKTDKLGSDLSGPSGLIGKFSKLFNMGGSAGGGAGSLGSAGGGLGGSTLVGLGLMVPAIGAVLVEVTGLVSGFAAAGAGAGAFYLLAHPAISNLQTDYKSLSSAQQAYNKAQEKAAAYPTTANIKAEATALQNLRVVRQGMTKDEGSAASGIAQLSGEYHKLTDAFRPEVFKIFNDGLKIANNLLPYLAPMANAFANALDGLLKQFDKFTQSQGFKDWMQKFTANIGPAVTAIGQGLGKLIPAFGKLLTLMSQKDVVNAINIAFTVLTVSVVGLTNGISRFMRNYDSFTSTIRRDSHDISSSFDSIRHGVAVAFDWVINFFRGIPGRIRGALASIPGILFNIGVNAMIGLYNGFVSWYNRIINFIENNLFGGIIGKALHLLGINSPSKVFADMGSGIVEGLVLGMDRNAHKALGSVGNLAKSVSAGFNPQLSVSAGSVAGAAAGRGNVTNNFTVNVSGLVGDAGATGRQIVEAANTYLRQTGQGQLVGA